jgi:hypothetical protein
VPQGAGFPSRPPRRPAVYRQRAAPGRRSQPAASAVSSQARCRLRAAGAGNDGDGRYVEYRIMWSGLLQRRTGAHPSRTALHIISGLPRSSQVTIGVEERKKAAPDIAPESLPVRVRSGSRKPPLSRSGVEPVDFVGQEISGLCGVAQHAEQGESALSSLTARAAPHNPVLHITPIMLSST